MLERIRTAIILLVIVGFCLFAPFQPWLMIGLMLVTATVAAREWLNLLPDAHNNFNANRWFIIAVPVVSALALKLPQLAIALWVMAVLYWIINIGWVKAFPAKTAWFKTPIMLLAGMLSITAVVTAIYKLWQVSPWLLLYVFAIVWIADSGAYFVGRQFGKRKLIPAVSPNKTVEGLVGGLVMVIVYVVAAGYFGLNYQGGALISLIILSFVTALFSVLGDLVESMHKRQAGIKDSGTFLPGHGGVLDRIDSILSATPVFALGFVMLNLPTDGF